MRPISKNAFSSFCIKTSYSYTPFFNYKNLIIKTTTNKKNQNNSVKLIKYLKKINYLSHKNQISNCKIVKNCNKNHNKYRVYKITQIFQIHPKKSSVKLQKIVVGL